MDKLRQDPLLEDTSEQVRIAGRMRSVPATAFVAGFVGVSNLLAAKSARRYTGTDAALSIRPERIRIGDAESVADAGECGADGNITDIEFLGATTRYEVALDGGGRMTVSTQNHAQPAGGTMRVGGRVRLLWRREDMCVLRSA